MHYRVLCYNSYPLHTSFIEGSTRETFIKVSQKVWNVSHHAMSWNLIENRQLKKTLLTFLKISTVKKMMKEKLKVKKYLHSGWLLLMIFYFSDLILEFINFCFLGGQLIFELGDLWILGCHLLFKILNFSDLIFEFINFVSCQDWGLKI